MHAACQAAADGLETNFACVLQYRSDDATLVLQAGLGWDASLIGRMRFAATLENAAGFSWQMNRPASSGEVDGGAMFPLPHFARDRGIRQMISVPIPAELDEPFGVLQIGRRNVDEFGDGDIQFLQAAAGSLAATLSRRFSRMREEEHAALSAHRATLLDELQHRIRNDLQGIHSLAASGARACADRAGREGLQRVTQQVLALATLYQHLDSLGSCRVNLVDCLSTLCEKLADAAG